MSNKIKKLTEIIIPTICNVCHQRTAKEPLCAKCTPKEYLDFTLLRCEICFNVLQRLDDNHICQICEAKIQIYNKKKFIFSYKGNVRDIIRTMKFRKSRNLCRYMASMAKEQISKLFDKTDWDFVIPIPSAKIVLRKRGYNQCDYLVQNIFDHINNNILYHKGYKNLQATLNYTQRKKNIKNRFYLKNQEVLADKKILIVDDILTTGATSDEVGQLIRNTNVQRLDFFALAKVELSQ